MFFRESGVDKKGDTQYLLHSYMRLNPRNAKELK